MPATATVPDLSIAMNSYKYPRSLQTHWLYAWSQSLMKSALRALSFSSSCDDGLLSPWLLINLDCEFVVYSGGGTVDFQEFVGGLSAFSSRGGREEKLRCTSYLECSVISYYSPNCLVFQSLVVAFKVYDVDRDGYISNGELFLVLKMMVGNNLKVCYFFFYHRAYVASCACFQHYWCYSLFRINNCNK